MNEYQEMLFDFMKSLPIKDELKNELYKAVLATELNTVSDLIKAKNVIFKLISDISDGTLTLSNTLRSAFVGAYNKSMGRTNKNTLTSSTVEEQTLVSKPVKFYNWLEEVEGRTSIKSNPNLENWLLW
ncbi:hypothetical protein [Psychrobacillus sp. FSL H8-0510]|uniref:hypothetical protein n=1 Tax=Psychrobacillus sp. FSL H8-0510 TaxID=2921394 RepID=UPI0030F5A34B